MVTAPVVGGGRLPERLAHPLCVGSDELCDEGEDGGVRVAVELGEEADGEGLEEGALHVAGAREGAPRRRGRDLERAAERPQGEGGRVTCREQNMLHLHATSGAWATLNASPEELLPKVVFVSF